MEAQPAEPFRQLRIGTPHHTIRQDRSRHHQRPRPQRRIEPTGQSEADEAANPRVDQAGRRPLRPFRRAAARLDRTTEPGGDARLRRQADDETKRGGQNPTSTRRVLPRRRLR
jgi:hypothetical protein